MDNELIKQSKSEQKLFLKNRLTGTVFWLLLLIIIVPVWYSNPVYFQPDDYFNQPKKQDIVSKSFTIPEQNSSVENLKSNNYYWIVKLVAYNNKQKAKELNDRLKYQYESKVKFYPETEFYSVRLGPYYNKQEAENDQIEINKLLRIRSQLILVKPKSKKNK